MPIETLSQAAPARASTVPQRRVVSVDVLRGFDMFWIIGGAELMHALAAMTKQSWLAPQFEHVDWAGLHFYDIIFPLFIFIIGVSLVFSLSKSMQRDGKGATLKRVVRRSIILYALGFFYNGGFGNPWNDLHFAGVLPRIAAAYLFAGLIFCLFKTRAMIAWCVVLLVGYDAAMTFVPMRDIKLDQKVFDQLSATTGEKDPMKIFLSTTNWTSGKFTRGYNLANQIDFQYMPGFKGYGYYDPDGLLSTIPVVASCLLGIFAGLFLRSANDDKTKVLYLFIAGAVAIAIGLLWSLHFPIVKRLWSPSFVLVTGGICSIALAAFYWVIEVAKIDWWCAPFMWVGMNSITIYLCKNIVNFSGLANRFFGGNIKAFLNAQLPGAGDFLVTAGGLALALLFCHALYKRKIFLRI